MLCCLNLNLFMGTYVKFENWASSICGLTWRCPSRPCKKPTHKKDYSVSILLYGAIWGVYLCDRPRQPAKSFFREPQTRFAGRRDAGCARDVVIVIFSVKRSQSLIVSVNVYLSVCLNLEIIDIVIKVVCKM